MAPKIHMEELNLGYFLAEYIYKMKVRLKEKILTTAAYRQGGALEYTVNFCLGYIETEVGGNVGFAYEALWDFAEAGLITDDTLSKIESLLINISRDAKEYAPSAYAALRALIKAGAVNKANISAIYSLLYPYHLVGGATENVGTAYVTLRILAEAGYVKENNIDHIGELLRCITGADVSGESIPVTHQKLRSLIDTLKKSRQTETDKFIEIFYYIAKTARNDTGKAYESLQLLVNTIIEKKLTSDFLDTFLLWTVAKDERLYPQLAFDTLRAFAEARMRYDAPMDIVTFFMTLADVRPEKKADTYRELQNVFSVVKKFKPNTVVGTKFLYYIVLHCRNADEAYMEFRRLLRAVAVQGLDDSLLDQQLLFPISSMPAAHLVINLLRQLAEGAALGEIDGVVMDQALLRAIMKHRKYDSFGWLSTLLDLASAVKKEGLDAVFLNKTLLLTIARGAKDSGAYDSLLAVAREVKIQGLDMDIVKHSGILTRIPETVEHGDVVYGQVQQLIQEGMINRHNLSESLAFLNTVLQAAKDDTQFAGEALLALVRAGAVDAENLLPVQNLLTTVAETAGPTRQATYIDLERLSSMAAKKKLDKSVLEPNFLAVIGEKTKQHAYLAYQALTALAEADAVTQDTKHQIETLFTAIAEGTKNVSDALIALRYLTGSGYVNKNTIAQAQSLFTTIFNAAAGDSEQPALQQLKEAANVTLKKGVPVLGLDIFTGLAEKSGSFTAGAYAGLVEAAKEIHARGFRFPHKEIRWGIGFSEPGEETYAVFRDLQLFLALREDISSLTLPFFLEQYVFNKRLLGKGLSRPLDAEILLTPYVVEQIINGRLNETLIKDKRDALSLKKIAADTVHTFSEEDKTVLYLKLYRQNKAAMEAVPYRDFWDSRIVRDILRSEQGDGEFFYLTDRDIEDLVDMSLSIERELRRFVEETYPDNPGWLVSFRELVEFHRNFIEQYFVDQGRIKAKDVIAKFILIAYSLYGDMFGEEIDVFKKILRTAIEEHFELFVRLSCADTHIAKMNLEEIIDTLQTASFSDLEGGDVLFGIPSFNYSYWALRRSTELARPSLVILPKDTQFCFKESVKKLSRKTRGAICTISCHAGLDRGIFAQALPDAEGEIKDVGGVLVNLIREAHRNPSRSIYLVFENAEALPEGLRIDFNSVLWERTFYVPELEETLTVPENLHLIFTMGDKAKIKDAAFLNRLEKIRIVPLDEPGFSRLLQRRYQAPVETAEKLSRFYHALNARTYQDTSLEFSLQDMINVLLFVRSRGDIYLNEEAYNYFFCRLRFREDAEIFEREFENIFGAVRPSWQTSLVMIGGNALVADGVEIDLGSEAIRYIEAHPGTDIFTLMLDKFGYVMRKQDLRVLSQLVRLLKYSQSDLSKFVVLEGISGEGKTQFISVIARLFGKHNLPLTIHRYSDPLELEGGVVFENGRLTVVKETALTEALQAGNHIINFSELNTSLRQTIAFWLDPLFRGGDNLYLPQIPQEDGVLSVAMSSDNLCVADVNPLDYAQRAQIPAQLRSTAPHYWMGYDYTNTEEDYVREIRQELTEIIKNLFTIYAGQEHSQYAQQLSEIYYQIQKTLYTTTPSRYQVLSLREIIRVIKIFQATGAFDAAVRDVLYGMWIEDDVLQSVEKVMKQHNVALDHYDPSRFAELVLLKNFGPVLIHSTTEQDGFELFTQALEELGDDYVSHYMTVSDFTDYSTFISGAGISEDDENLGVYPGVLLKIIEACFADAQKTHILVLDNFHQMSADTAVGFNRILQEGEIEIPAHVRNILAERLQRSGIMKTVNDFYGRLPANLRIIGIMQPNPNPASIDRLPMSGAEISRFISIRAGSEMTQEDVKHYLSEQLQGEGTKDVLNDLIQKTGDVFQRYNNEAARGIVLSRKDLDELVFQIRQNQNTADPRPIDEIIYKTIGCALPGSVDFEPEVAFPRPGKLILIKELKQVYSAIQSAQAAGRNVFLLEGHPGAGKTALAEDFAAREGLRFKKVSMYREVELSDFIGRLEMTGDGKFRITSRRKDDGRFLADFLDFVENGGVFDFDEGNISKNSLQVLSFLMHIIRKQEIDLGLYHNGTEIGRHKISVHPDFYVFVTYNPAGLTSGRKKMIRELGSLGKKIWVRDAWSRESYKAVIEHVDQNHTLSDADQEKLITLHHYIKYIAEAAFREDFQEDIPDIVKNFRFSEFKDIYRYQYSISPRELIRTVSMVQKGSSLYEAILLNYANQFASRSDFEQIVSVIDHVFRGFKDWHEQWSDNDDENVYRQIPGGIFFYPTVQQITALKALDLSLRSGHTMFLSEDGSYPYELLRAFCGSQGYELKTFWGNPFSNSVELLAGRGMVFNALEKNGAAPANGTSVLFGFIGEYLVEEERAPPKTEKPIVLYLGSLDVLSAEELEILNDFLETNTFTVEGKSYTLHPEAHLAVEAPLIRERNFSSPFFDRFQKVRVPSLANFEDMQKYLNKYYQGLTEVEQELIYRTAVLAWFMDTGRFVKDKHNILGKRFAHVYGFGFQDVEKLAELVMLERQHLEKDVLDPAMIVLKAALRYYGQALDDTNGDRQMFMRNFLTEVLSFRGIDDNLMPEIATDLQAVTRQRVERYLNTGDSLASGIRIEDRNGEFIVVTPGNKYLVKNIDVGQERTLSDGLTIRRTAEDTWTIVLGLIESIGDMPTGIGGDSLDYSLPPEEVGGKNFIEYSGVISEVASSMLWAMSRVRDVQGRERLPSPIFLTGPTGGAKSTLARNLGDILGVPVFNLNCFDGMEMDSLVGAMEIGKNREVLFKLQEFFSQLGKINGEYVYPQGKNTHAQRKILFLDEANVSPSILYLLRPLFEGQRNFYFYYLGMKWNIELDPEVILIIAGNPQERFEGRKPYSKVLLQRAAKIWVPALHEYNTSERISPEDAKNVLLGMHQRRMDGLAAPDSTRRFPIHMHNASPGLSLKVREFRKIQLRPRLLPQTTAAAREKEEKQMLPINIERVTRGFRYDLKNIAENLNFLSKLKEEEKLPFFLRNILPGFVLALGDGAVRLQSEDELKEKILVEAGNIDGVVKDFIDSLINFYLQQEVSQGEVKRLAIGLRQHLLRKNLGIFLFSFSVLKNNKIYLLLDSYDIMQSIGLSSDMVESLRLRDEVLQRLPLYAYAVDSHPLGEDQEMSGVYKGHSDEEGYYALAYAGAIGSDEERINWVGYHELGHLITELRLRFEQKAPPDGELFSMLFPLLFVRDPLTYFQQELVRWLVRVKDHEISYCQSAKGILNGFLSVIKEENPGDKMLQSLPEITDELEPERIAAIASRVQGLTSEKIKEIAAVLYTDAYEKDFQGDYYLNTTKKGKYKIKRGAMTLGDSISEITEGRILQPPDVSSNDIDSNDQKVIEQTVDIKGEGVEGEKEDRPTLKTDWRELEEGGLSGDGEAQEHVVQTGWVDDVVRIFSPYAQKIIDIFSAEPEQIEIHSKAGRIIDLKKYLAGAINVFKKFIYEDSKPSLAVGVTVDVSGSVIMNSDLVAAFTKMSKFFLSLMFRITQLNREGAWYGLSAIGDKFHPGLQLDNRHSKEALEQLVFSDDHYWMSAFNDHDGINTVNLIEGLRIKWQNKNIPRHNRLEIVFTDGGETSKESFETLREMVAEFEEESGVTVVFIGIGTEEVKNYNRYVLLSDKPEPNEFIQIISKLGEILTQRGKLPEGDLASIAAINKESSVLSGRNDRTGLPLQNGILQIMPSFDRAGGLWRQQPVILLPFDLENRNSLDMVEMSI